MKRFPAFLLVLGLTLGCSSTNIPNYVKDKHPYKKIFYADFDQAVDATKKTVEELGWIVTKSTDPGVYEQNRATESETARQILLFTEVRQTALFLGSRFAKMNIFLRSISKNETEIEIRYLTVTSVTFKDVYSYRKDSFVNKVFKLIDEKLK